MLASIHPLGERARGSRYALTAGAHVAGSAAAGIALGAGLGELGHLVGAPGGGRARSSVAVPLAAAARALVVLTMADVDDADRLRAAHRRLARLAPAARRASAAVVTLAGLTLVLAAAAST